MYNKLFTKILDSSIWLESNYTRIIWITLLATMDEDGFCQYAAPGNIAQRAIVPLEETEKSLKILESPDKNSFDPSDEGRRIQRVPGGWMVLNCKKYKELATRESSKVQNRDRVRKFRERNADVTLCNDLVTTSETETETQILLPTEVGENGTSKFIDDIWQFYLTESGMSPTRTQLTPDRRDRIKRWFNTFLKNKADTQGLPEKAASRVKAVIQGTCRDDFVGGNKAWLKIESILGSQAKIDKGLARYEKQERQRRD